MSITYEGKAVVEALHYVTVRKEGESRSRLFSSVHGSTRLRIHATRFDCREKAERACMVLAEDNPGYVFGILKPRPRKQRRAVSYSPSSVVLASVAAACFPVEGT